MRLKSLERLAFRWEAKTPWILLKYTWWKSVWRGDFSSNHSFCWGTFSFVLVRPFAATCFWLVKHWRRTSMMKTCFCVQCTPNLTSVTTLLLHAVAFQSNSYHMAPLNRWPGWSPCFFPSFGAHWGSVSGSQSVSRWTPTGKSCSVCDW